MSHLESRLLFSCTNAQVTAATSGFIVFMASGSAVIQCAILREIPDLALIFGPVIALSALVAEVGKVWLKHGSWTIFALVLVLTVATVLHFTPIQVNGFVSGFNNSNHNNTSNNSTLRNNSTLGSVSV